MIEPLSLFCVEKVDNLGKKLDFSWHFFTSAFCNIGG